MKKLLIFIGYVFGLYAIGMMMLFNITAIIEGGQIILDWNSIGEMKLELCMHGMFFCFILIGLILAFKQYWCEK